MPVLAAFNLIQIFESILINDSSLFIHKTQYSPDSVLGQLKLFYYRTLNF